MAAGVSEQILGELGFRLGRGTALWDGERSEKQKSSPPLRKEGNRMKVNRQIQELYVWYCDSVSRLLDIIKLQELKTS